MKLAILTLNASRKEVKYFTVTLFPGNQMLSKSGIKNQIAETNEKINFFQDYVDVGEMQKEYDNEIDSLFCALFDYCKKLADPE